MTKPSWREKNNREKNTDEFGQRKRLGEVEGKTHFMLHNIPEDLKARFKVACAIAGKDMKEVIFDFMDKYAEIQMEKKRKNI